MQFNFNSGVKESISLAHRELKKSCQLGEEQKEALKKANIFLDEGIKVLGKRQKHKMVADQSDYG